MKNVLIIRLSAIGDVAMCLPVVYSVARQNPDINFTFLTQPFLCSLFINSPSNLKAIPLDIKVKQKGLLGLIKYALNISGNEYDTVIDLHNVIRSRIIGSILSLKGCKIFVFEKDRKGRKALIEHSTDSKPLSSVINGYADTFRKAGLKFDIDFKSLFDSDLNYGYTTASSNMKIGIAPFAKHAQKIYPLNLMEEVIKKLSLQGDVDIYLFGSKGEEEKLLLSWSDKYPNVFSVVGKYKLGEELKLMSELDLMLSMDSANMHFAALAGTRVLSIWGATHPDAGFLGFNCKKEDVIQLDMSCRPCSIFGQKACVKGSIECLNNIAPSVIIDKINSIKSTKKCYK